MAKSSTIRVRLWRHYTEQDLRDHFHLSDAADVVRLTNTEDGKMTATISFASEARRKMALKEASRSVRSEDVLLDECFKEFRGFTALSEGTEVDIVALHGMDGHAFNSWAYKRGKGSCHMWLRDSLPEELKSSKGRILIYGYNANTMTDVGTGQIRTFAEEFLSALGDERKMAPNRPLVLVAHSLGGIVVKQALVKANKNPNHENILSSVRGVVFFGTPHRGGNGVPEGLFAAKLLKFLNLDVRSDLIRMLCRDSDVLFELTNDFIRLVDQRGIKVTTFVEERTTKLGIWPFKYRIWIVPDNSATLGISGEKVRFIDSDHGHMCKFRNGDAASGSCRAIAEMCTPEEDKRPQGENRPSAAPVPNNTATPSTFSGIQNMAITNSTINVVQGNQMNNPPAASQPDRQPKIDRTPQLDAPARDDSPPRNRDRDNPGPSRPAPQPVQLGGASYYFTAPISGGVIGGRGHKIYMNTPHTT